jgi:aromatic ring-opening dioxygenase catalytic subunit (LigB family)
MNPKPGVMPISNTLPELWANFKPSPDLETGQRVIDTLRTEGFDVDPDPGFNWMIDTVPLLIGMFGDKCPPVTIISQNSHWDPFFHARIGATLRHLREERFLLIGSGGGVHNLYLTEWKYMLQYKDNFAMERPPEPKTMEFRQSLEDIICKNGGGPKLKRGLTRLMKHPYFRDAHGTDEHYVSACFVAGAVSSVEDLGTPGCLGAEAWELVSLVSVFAYVQLPPADIATEKPMRVPVLSGRLAEGLARCLGRWNEDRQLRRSGLAIERNMIIHVY